MLSCESADARCYRAILMSARVEGGGVRGGNKALVVLTAVRNRCFCARNCGQCGRRKDRGVGFGRIFMGIVGLEVIEL